MKIRKSFWLEPEQAKTIEKVASNLKVSESEVLRRILGKHITSFVDANKNK